MQTYREKYTEGNERIEFVNRSIVLLSNIRKISYCEIGPKRYPKKLHNKRS